MKFFAKVQLRMRLSPKSYIYLAPLRNFGLFYDLDGHRERVFGTLSSVNGAKSPFAQKSAHFVSPFERQANCTTHYRLQIGSEIRGEMAANAHICKRKNYPAVKWPMLRLKKIYINHKFWLNSTQFCNPENKEPAVTWPMLWLKIIYINHRPLFIASDFDPFLKSLRQGRRQMTRTRLLPEFNNLKA